MDLYLVEPTKKYEKQAIEYIEEHYIYFSEINGSGGLDRYVNNYDNWLEKLEEDKNRIVDENRVPSVTYFLVRKTDDRIVGMVNIRLKLNDRLKQLGGNIGYGIRPTERRQGYNKVNLYLALLKCKEYGLDKVQLDCEIDNIGSKKTIEALGGVLEKEFYNEYYNNTILSYSIDVNNSIEKYKELVL